MQAPKTTPLCERHKALGGRMVEFAGYLMPVSYRGVIAEHEAVRSRVGLFDVSHMGRLKIQGSGASTFLQQLTCNDVSRLYDGRVQYSALLNPEGGVKDDVLVSREAKDRFLLVVNASNRAKILPWLAEHPLPQVSVEDQTEATGMVGLQGPRAEETLQPLTTVDLTGLRYYHWTAGQVRGIQAVISRTGYTGEQGFEITVPAARLGELWDTLLEAGKPYDIEPAGLGARDTLRLEMGYSLYGHELTENISPIEAGLRWIVALDKGPFVGRERCARGAASKIVGFRMKDAGIAREGYAIYVGERAVGHVTSGTYSPTLKQAVGLALVDAGTVTREAELDIDVRGHRRKAVQVAIPFYRSPLKAS